jgi:hypothetical protein
MSRTNWRVAPPPGIAFSVAEIAKREGRSVSNTITRLLGEAVDARRVADAQPNNLEVKRLLAIISKAVGQDVKA